MVENLLNGQLVGADGRLTWQQLEAEHKKKKFRNLGGETASLQVATVAQPVAISTSEVDSLRQLIEKMGEQMEADSNELRQQMKEESNKRQKVEKELQGESNELRQQLKEGSNKRLKVEKELESVKTKMHQIWGDSTFGKDWESCRVAMSCPAVKAIEIGARNEISKRERIRERKAKQKATIEKPIQKEEDEMTFALP